MASSGHVRDEELLSASHVNRLERGYEDLKPDPPREWLVDSGATCHILAKRHRSAYEVVHVHKGLSTELRAANGELIRTHGVVDLRVHFCGRAFVLTRCLIADIEFNVLSPFVIATHGWKCVLVIEGSRLEKGKHVVPLWLNDRAWSCASVRPPRKSRSGSPSSRTGGRARSEGASDMEVDQLSEKRVKGKVAGSRVGLLEVSVWQPLKEAPACREDTVKPSLRRAFATEEHVLAVTEECPATQVVCAFCVELCGARAGRWKIPRMRRKTSQNSYAHWRQK